MPDDTSKLTKCRALLLSGPVAAGKTTTAGLLHTDYGAAVLSTRAAILRLLPSTALDRRQLQAAGDQLDLATHGEWVADSLMRLVASTAGPSVLVVIDAIRRAEQADSVTRLRIVTAWHVHLTASRAILSQRYRSSLSIKELPLYEDLAANPTEAAIESLASIADLTIDTSDASPQEVASRVATVMGL
jgi:hypothetical protein